MGFASLCAFLLLQLLSPYTDPICQDQDKNTHGPFEPWAIIRSNHISIFMESFPTSILANFPMSLLINGLAFVYRYYGPLTVG
jgi:hypothetical protein